MLPSLQDDRLKFRSLGSCNVHTIICIPPRPHNAHRKNYRRLPPIPVRLGPGNPPPLLPKPMGTCVRKPTCIIIHQRSTSIQQTLTGSATTPPDPTASSTPTIVLADRYALRNRLLSRQRTPPHMVPRLRYLPPRSRPHPLPRHLSRNGKRTRRIRTGTI